MSHQGGTPAFDELERLGQTIAAGRHRGGRVWEPLRGLLAAASRSPAAELDFRLQTALLSPGPLASALLCLRMGLLAGLDEEACLDAAQAAMLARSDLSAMADSRIRRREGSVPRADVLRLALCAGERLDGSGPLGLKGPELDAPTRLVAAAWGFVDVVPAVGARKAVEALASRPELWAPESAALLRQAVAFAGEAKPPWTAPAVAQAAPAPEPAAPVETVLAERLGRAVEETGRRAAAAEASERRRLALAEATEGFAAGLREEFTRLREMLAQDRRERVVLRSMREEVEKAARVLGATEAEVEAALASGVADRLAAARAKQIERLERVAGLVRLRRERLSKRAEKRALARQRYARRLQAALERAVRAKKSREQRAREELERIEERLRAERARLDVLRRSAGDPWAEGASELARQREAWEADSPAAARARDEARSTLAALDKQLDSLLGLARELQARRAREAREHEEAMARLRAEAARELRRARGGGETARLRLRAELAADRLEEEKVAGEHLAALAEDQRRACEASVSQLRAKLDGERARASKELDGLRGAVVQRKRLVEDAKRTLAELARRREEAEVSSREESARFQLEAAQRLAETRRVVRERREQLRAAVARLEAEARDAAERSGEAAAAFEERRKRLDDELRLLRGEAADLRGRLASVLSERDALRRTLEASLSELDVSLTEAYFAADAARRELASLRLDQERLVSELERARRELEPLAARVAEESGALERQLDGLRELSGERLGGLSAVLRGRLLAGARGLDAWLSRAAEVGRRLAAARRALDGEVFERCREAGLRALREGRLPDARDGLRQALALRDDPELRAALDLLEPKAPREPGSGGGVA